MSQKIYMIEKLYDTGCSSLENETFWDCPNISPKSQQDIFCPVVLTTSRTWIALWSMALWSNYFKIKYSFEMIYIC
jgi:hypothetical protein